MSHDNIEPISGQQNTSISCIHNAMSEVSSTTTHYLTLPAIIDNVYAGGYMTREQKLRRAARSAAEFSTPSCLLVLQELGQEVRDDYSDIMGVSIRTPAFATSDYDYFDTKLIRSMAILLYLEILKDA